MLRLKARGAPLGRHAARALLAAGFAALPACAGHVVAPSVAPVQCEVGDTALVRDVIYFGRNRPDGGTVTGAEWQEFLDQVVTPRFPTGLTVVEGMGQWRGQSGVVEQERAEILTVLHRGDHPARRAVDDIVAEYKRRFHQEAVLRERIPACVRL